MKVTVRFDLNDEGDARAFDTHRMAEHTRIACASALGHIRAQVKYCYDLDTRSREELEAVRAVLLEELDGWEP